jgi:hypothetical protein
MNYPYLAVLLNMNKCSIFIPGIADITALRMNINSFSGNSEINSKLRKLNGRLFVISRCLITTLLVHYPNW